MLTTSRKRWILAAAIAAVPALTAWQTAHAQFRTGSDGHALDASNQVGSGGVNGGGPSQPSGGSAYGNLVTGNQIVTGNVTGGRQFRGLVPYRDPLAFTGGTVGQNVDAFVRDSSGIPGANTPAFNLNQPRAFYGDSRAVAPPIGTVQEGATGAYLQTGLTTANPYNSLATAPGYFSSRGGTNIVSPMSNNSLDTNLLVLPSTVNDQSLLTGAPLNGLRPGDLGQSGSDAYYVTRFLSTRRPGEPLPTGDLDANTIRQMRNELQGAPPPPGSSGLIDSQINNSFGPNGVNPGANDVVGPNGAPNYGGPRGVNPNAPQRAPGSEPLSAPLESTTRQPIGTPINAKPINSQPLGSDLGTSEGTVQQSLVSPARQSSDYAKLQTQLDRFNQSHPQTAEEKALQDRMKRIRDFQATKGNQHGPTTGPTTQPLRGGNTTTKPANPAAPADTGAANSEPAGPVKIESLAAGIKAPGLHDMMAEAEKLMHEDKFSSSIMKFNQAERVAPNNPLIPLGRAHAELGAGYYGKAEADLRKVIANDPALLMGQFDFKAILSPQRLAFLQKDLQDLAEHDVRSARPWFLLAYIAYNTNDTQAAAKYLSEAEKRAPKSDAVLNLMKTHWTLPAVPAAEQKDQQPNK